MTIIIPFANQLGPNSGPSADGVILDAEKARLEALLIAVPAPSNYQSYVIKKSLSAIEMMRQQTGEPDADYAQRINLETQRATPGNWSAPFFNLLDAAVASDTGEGSQGGPSRGT